MTFNNIQNMNRDEARKAVEAAQKMLKLAMKNIAKPVPPKYEDEIIERARFIVALSDFLDSAEKYYGDLESI